MKSININAENVRSRRWSGCGRNGVGTVLYVNEQAGLLQLVLTPHQLVEQVVGGGENVTLAVRVRALGTEDLAVDRPRPGCVGVILDGVYSSVAKHNVCALLETSTKFGTLVDMGPYV